VKNMNMTKQMDVQAYLDGELSEARRREVERLLETDEESRELFVRLSALRELVRANEPASCLPESREFYWSKLERTLGGPAMAGGRAAGGSPWWLKIFAPAAAMAATIAVVLHFNQPAPLPIASSQPSPAEALGVKTAAKPIQRANNIEMREQEMKTITFHHQKEGVMVVWLSSDE